jgi:hypothetical protein
MFAHRQMRMRDLAARGDEKPLRAESSSPGRFRAWANRSYPVRNYLVGFDFGKLRDLPTKVYCNGSRLQLTANSELKRTRGEVA